MSDLQFDSGFERQVYSVVRPEVRYHPDTRLGYTLKKTYEPDFVFDCGKNRIFIECKGRFRDKQEYQKYLAVREDLSRNEHLVFVLQNPNAAMPGAKRRKKDGKKHSISEWCDKHGFKWYTLNTLPMEWRRAL
jgi:hypothetical protein